jgi:hypothetical protein
LTNYQSYANGQITLNASGIVNVQTNLTNYQAFANLQITTANNNIANGVTNLSNYQSYANTQLASHSNSIANLVPVSTTITVSGLATGGGNLGSNVNIGVTIAGTNDYRIASDNTKALTSAVVAGAMAVITLTDAASVSWNMASGYDFQLTLAGNRNLLNPTNTTVGKRGRIRVIQDATGSRTLAFGSAYVFAGGTAPTLTTTASHYDVLYYDCVSSTMIVVSTLKNVN